jgi:hypothetical protein
VVLKQLAVLSAAAMMSGCRFWYKPIPVANAIGEEETVLAGDTVNVHREKRFEVYGPNSEAVYDGYEQLNRAYRAFERHLGAQGSRLAFVLFKDSVVHLDSATLRPFRQRGFTVVEYARPRSVRSRRRYSGIDYGGVLWPIAPTAARVMLARFAEEQLDADGFHSDSLLLEHFPLWYRAAVIHLVGEAGSFANDLEYVREKRGQWLPFRDLLSLVRPPSADSLVDPSRRGEADEVTQIVAAQSSTFARYLVEREGTAVLGRLARGYLAGRSLNEMIAEFQSAPRTVPELEQRWKVWIDTREE